MLVNGKEVFYSNYTEESQKQSINIQDKIAGATKNFDIISDVTSKELKQLEAQYNTDFSEVTNGFGFFDSEKATNEDYEDRKENYVVYDLMDQNEYLHRGLEIIADDSTQKNDDAQVIKILTDDEKKKEILDELFYDTIDLNNELWSIVYETCKKGDGFYEVVPDNYKNPKKIMKLKWLDPLRVDRIERNDKLLYFKYTVPVEGPASQKEKTIAEYKLMPWQVLHFKVLEDKKLKPYGRSLFESGKRTFRRLSLIEDMMLVYRISRSPEKRVFYIDVGNLNPVEAKKFLQNMKNSYRSKNTMDLNGKYSKVQNVTSITSDIFIPVKEGGASSRIETLQSGQAFANMDDVKYFAEKLLRSINIPISFIDDVASRNQSLSQIDSRFARFIERIQSQIKKGLNKLATLELVFRGFKEEDLIDYKLELKNPSQAKEVMEIEIINQKMSMLSNLLNVQVFPTQWILKKFLKFNDKEISDIMMFKKLEDQEKMQQQMGAGGADMGMAGADMGLGGADMGMAGDAGVPPEGGEVPADTGVPPEGGEVPAEVNVGAAPEPEQLTASVMYNLYGRKFLLEENKESFFDLIRYIKEREKPSEMMNIFESAFEELRKPRVTSKKTEGFNRMKILNELGGIDLEKRYVSVYLKEGEVSLDGSDKKIIPLSEEIS